MACYVTLFSAFRLDAGLLDRFEDVRLAALEALMQIARRSSQPVQVTPLGFLVRFMFSFTVASGVAPSTFAFLLQLNTPEANQAAEEALRRVPRNEDFQFFVETLLRAGRLDVLRQLRPDQLSKTKGKILQKALQGAEGGS